MNKQYSYETLKVNNDNGDLTVVMNRPDVKNAMNRQMVEELTAVFAGISPGKEVRTVILRGADGTFCAGGDVKDMQQLREAVDDTAIRQNGKTLSEAFGQLLATVNNCPIPVIAIIEGIALGGGFGLVCTVDIALAHDNSLFALSEVRLGLPPAQIAPYLVQRIGLTQTRRLGLSGSRIRAHEAHAMGLIHFVFADEEECSTQLEHLLDDLHQCAPHAVANTKKLLFMATQQTPEELINTAADTWIDAILSDEGNEGTKAFLEKRRSHWVDR